MLSREIYTNFIKPNKKNVLLFIFLFIVIFCVPYIKIENTLNQSILQAGYYPLILGFLASFIFFIDLFSGNFYINELVPFLSFLLLFFIVYLISCSIIYFYNNWLKKLTDTKKVSEEAREDLKNVVVGKILEIEKHPNADRLQVTKTDIGKEVLQIVCGAPNIKIGQMVPVALVGAKLAGGIEIKEAEIRGVKSFGMICAQDELGLGDNHEGIMILGENAKVGMEFAEYLKSSK